MTMNRTDRKDIPDVEVLGGGSNKELSTEDNVVDMFLTGRLHEHVDELEGVRHPESHQRLKGDRQC